MATRNLSRNKSTLLAKSGTPLGGGHDDHLPIGYSGGYNLRGAIQFNLDWTDVVQITSAVLHMKTTGQVHLTFAGDPDVYVERITSGSWTANSGRSSFDSGGGSGWSSSASDFDDISSTTTGRATWDVAPGENDWDSVDITTIMDAWAPTTVTKSTGGAGGAASNYGLLLKPVVGLSDSADNTEFWSGYGSNDPYIVLTYTTVSTPAAPTINSPTASEIVVSQTPTIDLTADTTYGATTSFDIEVDTTTAIGNEPDWTSLAWSTYTDTSDLTNPIQKVVGSSLTRGLTYAVRARTTNATGTGAWSATRHFRIAYQSTAIVTTPAAGHTAKVYYDAGTNTTPHFEVTWSYQDDDGHAQASASVKIYADSGGSPGSLLHTYAHTGATTTAQISDYAPANGTLYHISVTPTCSVSLAGTESAKKNTRVRWGRASYYYDATSAPASLGSVTYNAVIPANSTLTMEYSTTTTTTEPTTWYSAIATATSKRYLWHRATFMAWGSATPTSPTLQDVTFNYNANTLTADNWTTFTGGTISEGDFVFGTQCLQLQGQGTASWAYQVVSGLLPGRTYTLSAYIKTEGDSGAAIQIYSGDGSNPELGGMTPLTATQDWTRHSVSFTAPATSVHIRARSNGTSSTYSWFDAFKLEQSTIVTPWSPGFISGGVTVDQGGLQVDGSNSGVIRIRGTAGGTNDVVTLGSHGLILGTVGFSSGTAFPSSPATGENFYRTDLGLNFFYDGTRWLCTCLHQLGPLLITTTQPYSATASQAQRAPMPSILGGTDIYVEDVRTAFNVVTGGSALSGSHKWVATLEKWDSSGGTNINTNVTPIDSGASAVWRNTSATAIDATIGSYAAFFVTWTKTGTPGNLHAYMTLTYRIVAT